MAFDEAAERAQHDFDSMAIDTAIPLEKANAVRMLLEANESRHPANNPTGEPHSTDSISYSVALTKDETKRQASIRTTGGDIDAAKLNVDFTGTTQSHEANFQMQHEVKANLTGAFNGQLVNSFNAMTEARVWQSNIQLGSDVAKMQMLGTCSGGSQFCQYQILDGAGNLKAIALAHMPESVEVDKPSMERWDVFKPGAEKVGEHIGRIDFATTYRFDDRKDQPRLEMGVTIKPE